MVVSSNEEECRRRDRWRPGTVRNVNSWRVWRRSVEPQWAPLAASVHKSRARHGFRLSQKGLVLVFPPSVLRWFFLRQFSAVRRPVAGPLSVYVGKTMWTGWEIQARMRLCPACIRPAMRCGGGARSAEWRWILSIAAGVTRWSIALVAIVAHWAAGWDIVPRFGSDRVSAGVIGASRAAYIIKYGQGLGVYRRSCGRSPGASRESYAAIAGEMVRF